MSKRKKFYEVERIVDKKRFKEGSWGGGWGYLAKGRGTR